MTGTETKRRADAERSIAAILDAASTCFIEEPQASMAAIARAAGVGRVTLYAHFPSRDVLLEAVLDRTIAKAGEVMRQAVPDEGPAAEAFRRLLRSAWHELDQHRQLFDLAQRELGSVRLRERHREVVDHVEGLLERGRREGVFRTDLPLSWLVTTVYSLLHAAAEDVNAGQLRADEAPGVLEATLLPALAP
ncbi:TetR family transcriptional regulator [Lentzea sp. NPDC005914]|uniref:TetR/AcrR family transcriptional regulator n=1 Tax=Lentzea sp. NPDC005914 TaxID=3154572 RepID=UPI0034114B2A